jgi:hypothetical protein
MLRTALRERCQPKNGAVAADVKGDRADKIFGGYGSMVIAKQRRPGAVG